MHLEEEDVSLGRRASAHVSQADGDTHPHHDQVVGVTRVDVNATEDVWDGVREVPLHWRDTRSSRIAKQLGERASVIHVWKQWTHRYTDDV